MHSDLKCQNIVFDRPGKQGVLQIIDFGSSVTVSDPNSEYNDFVGTMHYLPPESTGPRTGQDLKKCDLWSLGVIAFILLFGAPPFTGASAQDIFKNILAGKLVYPPGKQSNSCKRFISRLLCDKALRMTADEALQHTFINGNGASRANLKAGCSSYVASLQKYHYDTKLMHILMSAVLSEMDDEEQALLSQGLLNWQKKRSSTLNNKDLVAWILNHATIDIEKDELSKTERVEELSNYMQNLHKTLRAGTFDLMPSAPIEPLSDVSSCESSMDGNPLGLAMEDSSDSSPPEPESVHHGDQLGVPDNEQRPLSTSFSGSHSQLNKRISKKKFMAILKKAPKEYDVDAIVADLQDPTGQFIELRAIGSYHERCRTVRCRPSV